MSHVAKYEFAIEHVNIDILKAAAANVAEMLGVQVTDTVSGGKISAGKRAGRSSRRADNRKGGDAGKRFGVS